MLVVVLAALVSAVGGAECTQLCPGFQPDDCSCTDTGEWAMWVCPSLGGVHQSKPYFCSQPTCGCNGGDRPIDVGATLESTTPAIIAPATAPPATASPVRPTAGPRPGSHSGYPAARQVLFKNSCPQSVVLKYSQGGNLYNQFLATLDPVGGEHIFDIESQQDKGAWVFTPYFAEAKPSDREICTPDYCNAWALSNPRQGQDWISGKHYAAICNPSIPACCGKRTPGYDAATGDCPGVNDMTWGTEVEFTFDGTGGTVDSFDISTNFKLEGGVYFNIPVGLTAMSGGIPVSDCNHFGGMVEWPYECLQADCTTAYQDPTDMAGNGAQLQCQAGIGRQTSYIVEFCPGGAAPIVGFSDAAAPPRYARTGSWDSASVVVVALRPALMLMLLGSALAMLRQWRWRAQQPHDLEAEEAPLKSPSDEEEA